MMINIKINERGIEFEAMMLLRLTCDSLWWRHWTLAIRREGKYGEQIHTCQAVRLISLCSVLPCRQKQHFLYPTCSTIHTSVSRVVARDSEFPPGWVIRLETTGNTGSEQSLPTTLRWWIGVLYGVRCVSYCQCRGPWNLISYVLERVIIFLGFRY
jgi:hypothetical protein